MKDLFETFCDLTRTNSRTQCRRQGSESARSRIAHHKDVYFTFSSASLSSWASASAQRLTSQAPTHKDRYISGGLGLCLIITTIDYVVRRVL